MGIPADEVQDIIWKYSIDRLLTTYYQTITQDDFGASVKGEYLEEPLQELCKLGFNDEQDPINFVLFGTIIADVLKKLDQELKPYRTKMDEHLLQEISKLLRPILA